MRECEMMRISGSESKRMERNEKCELALTNVTKKKVSMMKLERKNNVEVTVAMKEYLLVIG